MFDDGGGGKLECGDGGYKVPKLDLVLKRKVHSEIVLPHREVVIKSTAYQKCTKVGLL